MPEQTHTSPRGAPSAEDLGTAGANQLAHDFGDLARSLQSEGDTDTLLEELVTAAVRLVPGAQDGSLSLVAGRRQVISQHASSELPRAVDELQTETGQGPCLDAVHEQQTVRVADLSQEDRWPDFAPRAFEAGAVSMLSFQLYVGGDNLGALNLFSRVPDAFDDDSEQIGLLFASHAAVAFAGAQQVDHLHRALDTRDLIGQAKGILMERYRIDGDRAFRFLARISSSSERSLRDVAEELVHTGQLPPPSGASPSPVP